MTAIPSARSLEDLKGLGCQRDMLTPRWLRNGRASGTMMIERNLEELGTVIDGDMVPGQCSWASKTNRFIRIPQVSEDEYLIRFHNLSLSSTIFHYISLYLITIWL